MVLALASAARAAEEPKAADVLAHGDSDRFWVAQVSPLNTVPKSLQTTVYYRLNGQEDNWQVMARIPARAVSLASRGAQAAALLDDGQWMLLFTDSTPYTTGPLPPPARMIALAGSRDAWWAVGLVPGGKAALGSPRTQPTTRESAAASQPAQTRPATARLVLFSLTSNDWKPIAELPDDLPGAPEASLSVINESPYVAFRGATGAVEVRHLEGSRWVSDAEGIPVLPGERFKMLSHPMLARLWVEQASGPDLVYVFGPKPTRPMRLEPVPGSTPTTRTLAFAIGKLRMVADVHDKLIEQDFSVESAAPDGKAAPLKLPQNGSLDQIHQIQWIVVTVALAIAVFGSYRQRSTMRGTPLKLEDIPLAPYGRRLAAGLIDACPLILAMGAVVAHYRGKTAASDTSAEATILLVYWAAAFFYVLYTTLMEALMGRSVGKIILGLRIILLDGQPPSQSALVTRNLLRLIDVGVFFGPLIMILLFPLRQRAGDVAAGTIVIYGQVQPRGDEETTQNSQQPVQTKE